MSTLNPARVHDIGAAEHRHTFADAGRPERERAMAVVAILTVVMMGAELAAGWWSGSLALTADGWHMGTHALAIGGAWLAYRLSARADARYAFGGWKIEVLAAYTSGLALLAVALWLVVDSVARLLAPQPVAFEVALWVAVIGLAVNLASAALLMQGSRRSAAQARVDRAHGHSQGGSRGHADGHGHGHHDGHHRDHHHGHSDGHHHGHHQGHGHDHNFSAAYLHVLADALTSVLAIVALAGGAWFGWVWLDPAVALVGALVIAQWSFGVLAGSARALVDATAKPELAARIRSLIESDGDATVADLHVWQVGADAWSASLAIVADEPASAASYRERLAAIAPLRHITVEVHRCPGCEPTAAAARSATPAA